MPQGSAHHKEQSPNLRARRLIFWLAAFLWAALTFYLSASPDARGVGGVLNLQAPADKLYHAFSFGLLASLLYGATARPWLALALTSLYGVSDELHQHFVPGRSVDVLDWLADTLGAAFAIAFWHQLARKNNTHKEETM